MVLIHSQAFTYRLNSVLYTKSQRKILKGGGGVVGVGVRGEGVKGGVTVLFNSISI